MFQRSLTLPRPGMETFFLWGPRQTGKSTLLRASYPGALWIDLLKTDEFRRFLQEPGQLRSIVEAAPGTRFIVIDEVQKVPDLLDEVHWLMENRGLHFALSGSSARKVRRGQANLLGGRAVRYELHGLVSKELGVEFDLGRLLNRGYLPRIYTAERPGPLLESYVGDYLKEEVAAEGLVRNLPVFSTFLEIAALSDCELVNYSTIARDCGVSGPTIRGYFEILVDTLLGRWVPSYQKRPKRRVIRASKFYFADVGLVNSLARRSRLAPGSELFGKAFENWVHHEVRAYLDYRGSGERLSYWRLASGVEVDFVVGDARVAIEAKASRKIHADHLRGLRSLAEEHRGSETRVVVSLEERARKTEDGILILPARRFAADLWSGGFI